MTRFCFPLLPISSLIGSASAGVGALLDAPAERVFSAAVEALSGQPKEVDADAGVVTTSWAPEHGVEGTKSLIPGNTCHDRVRFDVRVRVLPLCPRQAEITIRAAVERRPVGGPGRLRWKRVASDGRAEQRLLNRIKGGL